MFEKITGMFTGDKTKEQVQAEEQQMVAFEEGNIASAAALKDYAAGARYEADFVKFLQELSENESARDIVAAIERQQWTSRQQEKMITFATVLLGKGVGTTFLTGHNDYMGALDDYTLIECLIPLGLTVYDLTPEFLLIMKLIEQNFKLNLRRSKGALFLERIGTQRVEFDRSSERNSQGYRNQKE